MLIVAAGTGAFQNAPMQAQPKQPPAATSLGPDALRQVVCSDDDHALERFIQARVDLQCRYEQGRPPWLLAARAGAARVLARLAPLVDTTAVDDLGNDALMLAAAYGHEDAVRVLVAVCDAKRANKVGWSALTYALAAGSQECVELLLPISDLEHVDASGDTPELVAFDSGFGDLAELVRVERWWRGLKPLRGQGRH